MKSKNILTAWLLFLFFSCLVNSLTSGQTGPDIVPERIAVTGRISADSITLRWAPLDFNSWKSGNTYGYRIEKYIMSRNGSLLPKSEKSILAHALKPLAEDAWERLAQDDRYGAIAAQALFGARFEVDLKQSNVFTIVNKIQENDQRFTFALFCADMSPPVAKASGLWFSDTQINKEETYLYRIVVNSIDSLRGSIFINPAEVWILPEPQNVSAAFEEQIVTLKWDREIDTRYTAYLVERSEDGKHFSSIADTPLVTVSPTPTDNQYEYAIDTLRDLNTIYHYRIIGITPFGEQSRPSRTVSGKRILSVTQVPFISSAESPENKSIRIQWNFPDSNNARIKGFGIERSHYPKDRFVRINDELLSAETREFEDRVPGHVNYYRVTAHGLDGDSHSSHVYFAQLVDSLPPSFPQGLEAILNDSGTVYLSWKPNTEPDIFGYRIYKAFHQSEELAQVTSAPVTGHTFVDHVNLNTLNENIYYRIMAVDISQNHSPLSGLLRVSLPDLVRPQAPVLLPVRSNNNGVTLMWIPGGSEDIVQYKLYRKSFGTEGWEFLIALTARNDSLYHFTDVTCRAGETYSYTVVSIDDANLESDPAGPVSGSKINNRLQPGIAWKRPQLNREESQITLAWSYGEPGVQTFRIFKAVNDTPPIHFTSVSAETKEFTDKLVPGQRYAYRIMALFEDGKKSLLSEAIELQY